MALSLTLCAPPSDQFDTDRTGRLSQLEVKRMLRAIDLFETPEELIEVTRAIDDDNSGTIEKAEYLAYVDQRCAESAVFFASFRERSRVTKLGFDGTTWRSSANITWLMGEGVMILTSLAVLAAVVYFSFILVPLTMAYFLTFLFGPIQDILIQRPLVCAGLIVCDKPCVRPGYQREHVCCGKMSWDDKLPNMDRKYTTPRQRYLEMNVESELEEGQWNRQKGRLEWAEKAEICCARKKSTDPKFISLPLSVSCTLSGLFCGGALVLVCRCDAVQDVCGQRPAVQKLPLVAFLHRQDSGRDISRMRPRDRGGNCWGHCCCSRRRIGRDCRGC
eukprot:SAG31_NODE_3894_length_3774_cov_2.376599_2_plen_332_part_00